MYEIVRPSSTRNQGGLPCLVFLTNDDAAEGQTCQGIHGPSSMSMTEVGDAFMAVLPFCKSGVLSGSGQCNPPLLVRK